MQKYFSKIVVLINSPAAMELGGTEETLINLILWIDNLATTESWQLAKSLRY